MAQPDLTGTTVIVTGAAGGLGSVMALSLAGAGANVAAFDLEASKQYMDELLGQARDRQLAARVKPFWCDIRDPASAKAAVDAAARDFGRIDGLVNAAGLGPVYRPGGKELVKFWDVDLDVWKSRIDANLTGPFIMAKTVAPRLVAQKRGKIVNVTTSYGTMVRVGLTPYGQSKAGLEAASLIWARDLAESGVTVNILVPGGAADTRMVGRDVQPDRSQLIDPRVMAAPIRWLMSRDADGVTGRRFIGKDWDPNIDPAEAAAKAGAPAAW
jgi:NAD(P)-dependent dehydrogenase (short-subunit alcohol dehydrogenase family)